MDFLDPKKRRHHTIMLFVGYFFVGIAIIITTIILLYEAYGFGLGKGGQVIQNGLIFFSSQPNPANIYIDGKLNKSRTNTSLLLPSGIYNVMLTRTGYRPWQRTIELNGESVEHFDYPLLIPTTLITKPIKTYTQAPALATQSPDRHWLVVLQPGSQTSFDVYDLTNPSAAPTTITLPSTVVSTATSSQSWQAVSWADDDDHVLLEHGFNGKTEYILLDRSNPSQSVNLNETLSGDTFTQMTLFNDKYDQYYIYNAANDSLGTASLSDPAETQLLSNVLSYQTYGSNIILFVTNQNEPAGKVAVEEEVGTQIYTIRTFAASPTYLLDTATYNSVPYVVAGTSNEGKIYVYQDPVGQLSSDPNHVAVPSQVFLLSNPNYVSFSQNAQFIMAEAGENFSVYDLDNQQGYKYVSTAPLDSPQAHATWMDGDRLSYVSGGKLIIFDYDHANPQTLVPANPNFIAFFTPTYNNVLTLAPKTGTANTDLTETSLYTPADQ